MLSAQQAVYPLTFSSSSSYVQVYFFIAMVFILDGILDVWRKSGIWICWRHLGTLKESSNPKKNWEKTYFTPYERNIFWATILFKSMFPPDQNLKTGEWRRVGSKAVLRIRIFWTDPDILDGSGYFGRIRIFWSDPDILDGSGYFSRIRIL